MASDSELQQSIAQFLHYQQQVRQLSAHTITNYRRDLRNLEQFAAQRGITRAERLASADIRDWASAMHRHGLAGSSIQRALSAARSLFNYLGRESGQRFNPAAGVRAPRQPRKLPKTLDADQMDHFLQSAAQTTLQRRDRAMAELFYSSGLRLAELTGLNLGDVDQASALVTVTGKGSKTRTLPVGKVALDALNEWLAVRHQLAGKRTDAEALFVSSRGGRISARNIQARLKRLGREAGMPQDVHPHMLRHSFASHMLESSGDLRAVQELLGHANISTTQIYTHLDFQHLAKVYDDAHPRARKRGRKSE